MALSRRCKSSFRKECHIHFEERIICHIEKRVLAIFDWEQRLVLGFIRDFERIIISNLPSVSPCIQGGRLTMVNRISATLRRMPVIRFRYEGPDQRGFSFCEATIKSRKQFAARNSHKGDGRTAAWAILFNDGTLKRRGHLIDFRHELRQIPLPSVVNTFSSGKLTAHRHGTLFCTKIPFWYIHDSSAALEYRLSVWQSAIVSVRICPPPLFHIQLSGVQLYLVWSPALFASHTNRACEPTSFGSHYFVLTVGILALAKTPGNHLLITLISDYPLHFLFWLFSFEFLLLKYKKYILTPSGRTKTKLEDNKRKSTHPSLDGC